jgi:hypothetical protein
MVRVRRDSWEPYKALMHVDKLHDYLRANNMLKKEMIQFIGLATYCRDNVSNMIEMVKPLRDMIPLGLYQWTDKLIWTTGKICDT